MNGQAGAQHFSRVEMRGSEYQVQLADLRDQIGQVAANQCHQLTSLLGAQGCLAGLLAASQFQCHYAKGVHVGV